MADATVFFATNRRPNRQRDPDDFTDEIVPDVTDLRFGWCDFAGADLRPDGDLVALGAMGRLHVARERLDPADAGRSRLGSTEVFERVRAEMAGGCDALVFVHGYNYTFREAAARAAQIRDWLSERPMLMLMFSWPSRGAGVSPKTYDDERERAAASGKALGRAVLKARDFLMSIPRDEGCEQRIHLLCHSMGNWAMRGAVQGMRTFVGDNIPPLFDEVLLMAADEDDDTLAQRHKLALLLRGCRRVTVYTNRLDKALKASDVAMGNPDRLGRAGPENREALPEKVATVSAASVIDGDADPTGHQYYRNNPRVRRDMLAVLDGETTDGIAGRNPDRGMFVLS